MEITESKFRKESFDYIVIGSSPLMLLQAIVLADDGYSVCVVDRESQRGGAWKTHSLEIDFHVEIACHLIEVFPSVYEYLSEISGVPFVPLEKQPVRLHRSGFIFPYSSRLLVLGAGLRLLFGFIIAYGADLFFKRSNKNDLLNFRSKLKSFWLYQIPIIFIKPIMKAPKFGFVDFLNRLIDNCEHRGIRFLEFDVNSITFNAGRWHVSDQHGNVLISKYINSATSTNLRHLGVGRFKSVDYKMLPKASVLVKLSRRNVLKMQSYVAFWKDPEVTRISRIDQMRYEEEFVYYLVEIRIPAEEVSENLNTILRRSLEKSAILRKGADFSNLEVIKCYYIENIEQLPPGRIDEGFTCFYSFGNLAAGISHWLAHRKQVMDSKK